MSDALGGDRTKITVLAMYRGRKTVPLYIGIEPAAELQLRALYIRTYDKGDGDVTHDVHTRAARENRK